MIKYTKAISRCFILAFSFVLLLFLFLSKSNLAYYTVVNPAQMYWYPNEDVENISYYMLTKKEIVQCDYIDQTGKFYFCEWKFSFFRDPLYGWIKTENLRKILKNE